MKYLICFSVLIFNLAQDASTTWQNSNTKQEENLQKKEGRHLILVTLLQHLNQTGWDQRFGNISYSLYPTFKEENTTQSLLPNRDQDNRDQDNIDQDNIDQDNIDQDNIDQDNIDQDNTDQENTDQENTDPENTDQENTDQENIDQELEDQETTTCCKQEDVPETFSVGIRQPAGPMKMSDLFFSTQIDQFMKGLQKTGE
eukprot:GFUD01028820.1.p1 GENE.GFUD01028820.1~~GFUD01028820.1.p1  ORF type:complete len:200 (-),score=52.64 GFUD01028820.1:129-728(-)